MIYYHDDKLTIIDTSIDRVNGPIINYTDTKFILMASLASSWGEPVEIDDNLK